MEEEKILCPNCGKELTKSARKCKYCETRIVPVKIQTTRKEKLITFLSCAFIFSIIAIVVIILITICKIIINLQHSADGFNLSAINRLLTGSLLPWLVDTGIGPAIGTIVFGGIIIAIFVDSIKQALPGTKEILEELASIDFKQANNGKNESKKEDDMNVTSVVIKDRDAYIYDAKGHQLGKKTVQCGSVLVSCGGKCFTIRNENHIETYEYKGSWFGFVRISSRNV